MVKLSTARIALFSSLVAGGLACTSTIAYAQDAESRAEEFSAVLSQIQDTKLVTAQREVMIASQQSEIESLRSQIEMVPATKDSVREIVTRMTAEIEKVIESDLPFRKDERFARLDALRAKLAEEGSSDADLFRRAMTIYDVEANYGYTIAAYTGDHPTAPGRRLAACREDSKSAVCNLSKDQAKDLENGATVDDIKDSIKDGNYVHFGRMSFIYLDLDSREGFRWSKEENQWEPLASGDILNARKAVRIARGESAPGVVTAPIKMQAAR